MDAKAKATQQMSFLVYCRSLITMIKLSNILKKLFRR